MQKESNIVIQFWYELASTYSYPAASRIENEARKLGVTVQWQPFLLGPILSRLGWNTSPFNLQPAKGRYMWRDLERLCEFYGLKFRRPEHFPQHSLLATRTAQSLIETEHCKNFTLAVYEAQFVHGRDISKKETLLDILNTIVDEPEQTLSWASQPGVKQALKSSVERADSLGIFGAPSFITTDGELFWGNDRLEAALQWACRCSKVGSKAISKEPFA